MVDFSESEPKLETSTSSQSSSNQNPSSVEDAPLKTDQAIPETAPLQKKSLKRKPFPWPFCLALLLPIGISAVLIWGWNQEDYLFVLRAAWIVLYSIPGIYLMVVFGSLAQFRQRPFFSSFSLLISGAVLGGCCWTIQKITETQWLY